MNLGVTVSGCVKHVSLIDLRLCVMGLCGLGFDGLIVRLSHLSHGSRVAE
jgi:hypothetical protein